MTSKTYTLNTIEDLVQAATSPMGRDKKFELSIRTDDVFVDPEEGAAWQDLLNEVREAAWEARKGLVYGHPERAALHEKLEADEKELRRIRPEMTRVTHFTLVEKTEYYSSTTRYELSPQLGASIESIWTMVPAYRGASYTVPAKQGLTLAGICKRLGKSDIADQIKEAKAAEEARALEIRRSNVRLNAAKMANELLAYIEKNRDLVELPRTLEELSALANLTVQE